MECEACDNVGKSWTRVFDVAGRSKRKRRKEHEEQDGYAQSREVAALEYSMGDLEERSEQVYLFEKSDVQELNFQPTEAVEQRSGRATCWRSGRGVAAGGGTLTRRPAFMTAGLLHSYGCYVLVHSAGEGTAGPDKNSAL